MSTPAPFSAVSFRDPDGVLQHHEGRVLRLVREQAAKQFEDMLGEPVVAELMRAGHLVPTRPAMPQSIPEAWRGAAGTVYEHERIPFVSYPCEWPPAMLARAAEFTLELALKLLPAGLILKDATPANVLFRGSQPVFVDLLSIVRRPPGSFLWLARQQFEACFLLPLIANIEAGIPIGWSLQDPASGISHEQVARILGARRWIRPGLIGSVALPALLGHTEVSAGHGEREPRLANDERARYTLERTLRSLLSRTRRLAARTGAATSHWGEYSSQRQHYRDADLDQKRAFVARSLEQCRPDWVLDIGANTGEFSALAARTSRVVAIDVDEVAAGAIFRRAQDQSLDIHPLVVNFARPTPAGGWRNAESVSFLDRCHERFEMVLMLAVIHHLRITCGVPLASIVDTVARITRRELVVEFVPSTDPMFVRIARGRERLYQDYTRESFESLLSDRFDIVESEILPNGRVLYRATRRQTH